MTAIQLAISEDEAFVLNSRMKEIREKLEQIVAVAATARLSEQRRKDGNENWQLISLMGVIEDIAVNISPVHDIEGVLAKLN